MRDDEVLVVVEGDGERALVVGLGQVVELLGGAVLELLEQRLDVETGRHGCEHLGHARDLVEVAHERFARARVLDLDGDLAAVVPEGLVHLTDRRCGSRCVVELGEPRAPVVAEGLGQLLVDRRGRHGRRGVLQFGQRGAVGTEHLLRQRNLGDAQRLAELHRAALELAEGLEHLLGGALLDLACHGLRGLATDLLAKPDCRASGIAEGECGEARAAGDRASGEVGHAPIVRPSCSHPHPQTGWRDVGITRGR